jgi:hypothetical protein
MRGNSFPVPSKVTLKLQPCCRKYTFPFQLNALYEKQNSDHISILYKHCDNGMLNSPVRKIPNELLVYCIGHPVSTRW